MGDLRGKLKLDHLLSEQSKRPIRVARWWLAQTRGDDPGLFLTGEAFGPRRCTSYPAFERLGKAKLDESLADVFDGLRPTTKSVRNLLISPSGAIGIRLQQNLSATNPLA